MSDHVLMSDRWHSRDFPVLLDAARALEEGVRPLRASDLEERGNRDLREIIAACDALVPSYLDGRPLDSFQGVYDFGIRGLTEKGRRAVGLWPSGEAADVLVEALRQAEAATDDPEEQSLIHRAAGALGMVSRGVMTDVIAAVIRQQTGLNG